MTVCTYVLLLCLGAWAESPITTWILCMEYFRNYQLDSTLITVLAHPHDDDYVFTPNVSHSIEFKFWEPILILNYKNLISRIPQYI